MESGRLIKDRIIRCTAIGGAMLGVLILIVMAAGLCIKSYPILAENSILGVIASGIWKPLKGSFGLIPFMAGTLWVTAVALVIAVPLSILTAIYISEYAGEGMRRSIAPLIDLLAGIPSVIYGVWGLLVIVPLVKNYLAPVMGKYSSGYSVLSAGIVLAVMILPVIIHILVEVFQSVPRGLRDASLSLGATRWQTTSKVVLRKSLPGIFAALILGCSRAFGETMAVLMVAGNVPVVPESLFDPAYPLPALIANNYGEMMSIPLYDSALMLAALVLFLIVLGFNVISRYVLLKINRRLY